MNYRSKAIVTAALLFVLGGIGAVDMYWSQDTITADLSGNTRSRATSSTPTTAPNGQGVAKRTAPDVMATLAQAGFEVSEASDRTILEQVVTDTTIPLQTLGILKNGDRIGAVIWMESPDVKDYFSQLKDALLASFSPQVTDLEDTTKTDPGQPVRNELTFFDPGLSEERLKFVRMGERLLEFHIANDRETDMQPAMDALSKL